MEDNPLKKVETLGQALWLDSLTKDMFKSGKLKELIEEDGLRGITSNASIFEKAISESHIYDIDIRDLTLKKRDAKAIYETLSLRDIQNAADEFRSIYEKTNCKDGYVSHGINPHLAYDTNGTIEEARRLWAALNRPNILIKIPATTEGLPAIKQLISEGINVDANLLFGLPRYRQVIRAYIAGLTARIDQGKPVKNIASVASFFLDRIDAEIDPIEDNFTALGGEQAFFALSVRGQVAISSTKVAYKIYMKTFESEQFAKLADKGALPQRLRWAYTKPKNPDYNHIKYIEALIGPETINTINPETLQDYRKHGDPAATLETDLGQAYWVLSELPEIGINIDIITERLEKEGIEKSIKSFDKLLKSISKKSLEK
jgi:transaldolase